MSGFLFAVGGGAFLVFLVRGQHRFALAVAGLVLLVTLLPHVLARHTQPVRHISDSAAMAATFEARLSVICSRRIGGRASDCAPS